MSSHRSTGLLLVLFFCVWFSDSQAGVVATTGLVSTISAPDTVIEGHLGDNNTIFLFPELQDVTIGRPIVVDISQPGIYDQMTAVTPDTLPAGTPFSSYLLHLDPVGSQLVLGRSGSVTFDVDILGIIVRALSPYTFGESDSLAGLSTTAYPSADTLRGLELTPEAFRDKVTFSADRRTLTIDRLGTDAAIDQIRILTVPDVATGTGELPGTPGGMHVGNLPNPFNPSTQIRYTLPAEGPVRLTIHDVGGRLVRTLAGGTQSAGDHGAPWDGRNRWGRAMPSGVYFLRLEHMGSVETRKIVLAR